MTGEICARVVRCRLDAGCAQPFLRGGFRHAGPAAWAKANRPRLIWAALTLVRHWVAGGQPNGTVLLGSFESYCRTIGGVLACGGIEGFLDDLREEHRRSDEETTEWAAFVAAWHGQFAGQWSARRTWTWRAHAQPGDARDDARRDRQPARPANQAGAGAAQATRRGAGRPSRAGQRRRRPPRLLAVLARGGSRGVEYQWGSDNAPR